MKNTASASDEFSEENSEIPAELIGADDLLQREAAGLDARKYLPQVPRLHPGADGLVEWRSAGPPPRRRLFTLGASAALALAGTVYLFLEPPGYPPNVLQVCVLFLLCVLPMLLAWMLTAGKVARSQKATPIYGMLILLFLSAAVAYATGDWRPLVIVQDTASCILLVMNARALRSASIRARADKLSATPGSTLRVQVLTPPAWNAKEFRIRLVRTEETRRPGFEGGDIYHHHQETLPWLRDGAVLQRGKVEFQLSIPREVMHSFRGRWNQIRWDLEVAAALESGQLVTTLLPLILLPEGNTRP